MPAYRLVREQFLPHPIEQVFAFFSNAGNLESLTPPDLHFRILTPRPIEMRPGTMIDYRLKLSGIPMVWRTRIETFDPPHSFSDVQLRGPYAHWRHLHEFRASEGGTLMRDVVDYALPFGPLGWMVHAIFVRRSLAKIFDYRRDRISGLLADSQTARPL